MKCPDCGYIMSDFDAKCPRCVNYQAQGMPTRQAPPSMPTPLPQTFTCPRCRASVAVDARFCPACGWDGTTPMQMQGYPVQQAVPAPNQGLIFMMWLLSVVSWCLWLAGSYGPGLLVDVVAFIMAICLVASPNQTDKGNGKAKLWLEFLAFLVAFFVSCSATQSQRYGSTDYAPMPAVSAAPDPVPPVQPPVLLPQSPVPPALPVAPTAPSQSPGQAFSMPTKAGGGPPPNLEPFRPR